VAIRITCISKAAGWHEDPHSAITHLNWLNEANNQRGRSTRTQIYDWLRENSTNRAYVTDWIGNRAYLYTRENGRGTKFVQTYSDTVWTDNLLALPECTI
jgi:hypothetical protein